MWGPGGRRGGLGVARHLRRAGSRQGTGDWAWLPSVLSALVGLENDYRSHGRHCAAQRKRCGKWAANDILCLYMCVRGFIAIAVYLCS